jgi:hypothetical protein
MIKRKHPDFTFWTRLLSFTDNIEVNDIMSHEELEYIKWVAKQQLKQQYQFATGGELEYLKGLKTEEKIS